MYIFIVNQNQWNEIKKLGESITIEDYVRILDIEKAIVIKKHPNTRIMRDR